MVSAQYDLFIVIVIYKQEKKSKRFKISELLEGISKGRITSFSDRLFWIASNVVRECSEFPTYIPKPYSRPSWSFLDCEKLRELKKYSWTWICIQEVFLWHRGIVLIPRSHTRLRRQAWSAYPTFSGNLFQINYLKISWRPTQLVGIRSKRMSEKIFWL